MPFTEWKDEIEAITDIVKDTLKKFIVIIGYDELSREGALNHLKELEKKEESNALNLIIQEAIMLCNDLTFDEVFELLFK